MSMHHIHDIDPMCIHVQNPFRSGSRSISMYRLVPEGDRQDPVRPLLADGIVLAVQLTQVHRLGVQGRDLSGGSRGGRDSHDRLE